MAALEDLITMKCNHPHPDFEPRIEGCQANGHLLATLLYAEVLILRYFSEGEKRLIFKTGAKNTINRGPIAGNYPVRFTIRGRKLPFDVVVQCIEEIDEKDGFLVVHQDDKNDGFLGLDVIRLFNLVMNKGVIESLKLSEQCSWRFTV